MDNTRSDNFFIKQPSDCSQKEINDFYEMVLEGGQDVKETIKDGVNRSYLLGFHYVKNDLIGIAAIKKPMDYWKSFILKNAKLTNFINKIKFEFGYVYTRPEFENNKICSNLTRSLLKKVDAVNIFATTKTTNKKMIHILEKNGFKKYGNFIMGVQYQKDKYLLQVLIRMIHTSDKR